LEVYRKRCSRPAFGTVAAPPISDGFLVMLALAPCCLSHDGQAPAQYAPDGLYIQDLTKPFRACIDSSFDWLLLHVTRAALDGVAQQTGAAPIERLHCVPGTNDAVLAGLGRALLPALHCPIERHALFIDQLAIALNLHVAQCYGGLVLPGSVAMRGLSPAQERRAKEFLSAQLEGDASISAVAEACGLSRSYFIKSFKESTGKTPYRWLLELRLSRARNMLARSSDAIAEIAIACGFADQSHLTRMFTREIGMPPSVWRRDYRV
jgi:AraC-like DNA-binding protein